MAIDRNKDPGAIGTRRALGIAQRMVEWSIAMALLGAAWLVDPFAEAGFDAPKRFVVLLATAIGGAALLWQMPKLDWKRWSRTATWAAGCTVAGIAGLIIATIVSPRPEQAWPALRALALYGIFLPLGASNALCGPAGRRLLVIAGIATVTNAVLSLLQAAHVSLPIRIAQLGGRLPTGALLGNEGYVALACALLAAASVAFALNASDRKTRVVALVSCALGIVTIAVNQQITSAIALAVAALVVFAIRWNARWLAGVGAAAILVASAAALVPSLRAVTWGALPVGGIAGYQRLTTFRLGPWAAAAEMALTRPFTGYGPGTYAAEGQTARLAAELRMRERLVPPPYAIGVAYAHQEYLQLAAEAGVPTLLALLAALGTLMAALLRLARSPGDPEPLALFGVLVAGAVASLAWFPLQIPFTMVVLLLACGRAWRVIADQGRVTG